MSSRTNARKTRRAKGEREGVAVDAATHPFVSPVPSNPDKKTVMQSAVKFSLTAGVFIDTKFYAYSRKHQDGVVDQPRPLYANSAILKASSRYFEGCKPFRRNRVFTSDLYLVFAGGYKEAGLSSFDGPVPLDMDTNTEEYDYLSDSDLDEDENTSFEGTSGNDPEKEVESATPETDKTAVVGYLLFCSFASV